MAVKPITVALPWHSLGHGNLGVDALTRSNIAIIRAAAARIGREARFITLCSTGQVAPGDIPEGVEIGPMPRIKPLLTGRSDYLAALRRCDLVVDIGEGDSWADIYGRERLAFHAGTKIAALALGKPLVLAPQTIGPFNNPFARWLSDRIMARARAVFARDDLSSTYFASRGLKTPTDEFIDVAFRLPFERQARIPGVVRAGVNVSGLLYRGGYTGRNELGLTIDYVDYTRRLIAALVERGAEVHLVPHVGASGGNDDDLSVVPDLTERFPMLRVPDRFPSASAAKGFMSGLDFVVGGRMHACIGAFSAGTPVVPLAYSRKFNGLFGTLGYAHYVDGKAVDTDTALAQTLAGFDNRDRLAQDIEAGLAIAAARLDRYEAALAEIMAGMA